MKFLALDVGAKRIGVARGDDHTRIAVPVGWIPNDGSQWLKIAQVAGELGTDRFIVGLPRSNSGNETAQSAYAREFARALTQQIPGVRVKFQDETLTSVVAEERLKASGHPYEKGDIDAEAATIILQDYLEQGARAQVMANTSVGVADINAAVSGTGVGSVSARESANSTDAVSTGVSRATMDQLIDTAMEPATAQPLPVDEFGASPLLASAAEGLTSNPGEIPTEPTPVDKKSLKKAQKQAKKAAKNHKKATKSAQAPQDAPNPQTAETQPKKHKKAANLGWTLCGVATILLIIGAIGGGLLYARGLIREQRQEEYARQEAEMNASAFDFTVRPGETVADIEDHLVEVGYSRPEARDALNDSYDYAFLAERPKGATLEGYLFGETKQFFGDAPATEVVDFYLSEMQTVIEENNLEEAFAAQGLTLHEGITLASIVQKEAGTEDMPMVARVFLNRLDQDIALGSDVTVSYALDTVDPDRDEISSNGAALSVDSCYNTRLNKGLPCGPISNPGLEALLAVANPAEGDYLYFLTGDDGLMYYSYTEDEHTQNAAEHCQNLCQVSL